MQDIKVVMTMDCEPTTATSHPQATGPANWSAGEDAVRGYVEIAANYGLPITAVRDCSCGFSVRGSA